MSHEIIKKQQQNVLSAINEVISNIGLDDVKTSFNSKTGTASVTGNRNGIQYTTTLKRQQHGVIQTNSQFDTNVGKDALITQVKELYKQGYKQQQIADMLNISQTTVHNYLKK